MKARYQRGGVRSASRGYRILNELVEAGLQVLPAGGSVSGGAQTDAACLQFADTTHAIAVGRRIFGETFRRSQRGGPLLWIRGVILADGHPQAPTEDTRVLNSRFPAVQLREFKPSLLRAIHAEQSGFRGQRLLIENKLMTPDVEQELRRPIGQGYLLPAHKLRYSRYPSPTGHFKDVLWPIPDDLDEWAFTCRRMTDRMRWASDGGDAEFLQAAATNLLFEEISSIIHSLNE